MILRLLGWLALVGFPVWALVRQEEMLPPGMLGKLGFVGPHLSLPFPSEKREPRGSTEISGSYWKSTVRRSGAYTPWQPNATISFTVSSKLYWISTNPRYRDAWPTLWHG